MKLNLTELTEIAKNATPGPWQWQEGIEVAPIVVTKNGPNRGTYVCETNSAKDGTAESDAKFIAAFNPQVCLALIARLQKAREHLLRIRTHGCCVMHNDGGCPGCESDNALKEIDG